MKFFSYLIVELNRIFHLRTVYMIILFTMISPIVGCNLKGTMFNQSTSGDLIVKPCITYALISGVLFGLLTLIEFHHVNKRKIGKLINNIVSPLMINVVRITAIGIIAIVSVIITALMYFPYVVMKMEYSFNAYTYFESFFLFIPFSTLLSILAAFSFYEISHRILKKYKDA